MFEFTLNDCGGILNIISGMSRCLHEMILQVDEDGVTFGNLDIPHIRFFNLRINKETIDDYHFEKEEKILLNIDEIELILNTMLAEYDNPSFYLKYDDENESLKIKIGDNIQHTFTFKTPFKPEYDLPFPPNLDYDLTIDVPTKKLDEAVKMLNKVSLAVQLSSNGSSLELKSCPNETKGIKYSYYSTIRLPGNSKQVLLKKPEKVATIVSVETLWELIETLHFDSVCRISIGDDLPLRIVLESPNKNSVFTYMQAPRINPDAED